jgi:hypothetical protein
MKKLIHLTIYLFATFILISLLGCEGWSIMGYALDESQDSTQVKTKEIDE